MTHDAPRPGSLTDALDDLVAAAGDAAARTSTLPDDALVAGVRRRATVLRRRRAAARSVAAAASVVALGLGGWGLARLAVGDDAVPPPATAPVTPTVPTPTASVDPGTAHLRCARPAPVPTRTDVLVDVRAPRGAVLTEPTLGPRPLVDLTIRSGAAGKVHDGGTLEVALVRDGLVVAAATTDVDKHWWLAPSGTPLVDDSRHPTAADPWWVDGDGSAAGVADAASTLEPTIPGASCLTGEPLADGDYDLVVVAPGADSSGGTHVHVSSWSTVALVASPTSPSLEAPVCGAAVTPAGAGASTPRLTIHNPDGTSTDPLHQAGDAPGPYVLDTWEDLVVAAVGRPDATTTLDAGSRVGLVVVRDGVVVATPGDVGDRTTHGFRAGATTHVLLDVATPEPCPGADLTTPGELEVWGVLAGTLTVDGTEVPATVHGGPWAVVVPEEPAQD